MTQSPAMTTAPPEKKLVKGVGYTTIFASDILKVEISLQESTMKRTVTKNGQKTERLYSKVNDKERIRQIEFKSENWTVRGLSGNYAYILLEQKNAGNRLTGFYKIIKKTNANVIKHVIGSPEVYAKHTDDDWIYYERRPQE